LIFNVNTPILYLMMAIPEQPKIYHILHVDRLASVVADGYLWSDAEVLRRQTGGTTIGMSRIKARRLNELHLTSHRDLRVGQCAPFYFCFRSVMLFLIHCKNEELTYKGGQGPIVHLQADLHLVVDWATQNNKRWAFTLSNAGANYFEDHSNVERLGKINWDAVQALKWSGSGVAGSVKEGKQAEFLVERGFPWHLVERIGYLNKSISPTCEVLASITDALKGATHRPVVEKCNHWYY
jgi:ssDNA thymidine ADP-ribosyltransferase, DarT